MKKTIFPKWVRKVIIASKSRERYFLKRYGSLDRMKAIDKKLEDKIDEDSFYEECPNLRHP